jgi:triacylglycerol lipase
MGKIWLLVVLCALAGCSSSSSGNDPTPTFASGNAGMGPTLAVMPAQFEQAFSCNGDLAGITRDAVLLTPAFSTDEESFGWNYLRQFEALGIPACSLSIPDGGFSDLQNAAEYVVHAVRRMHAEGQRKVILFGHQHGPLDELWALKFWPDLQTKVSSLISLATPYNGTTAATQTCGFSGMCPPSVWQIAAGSNFLAALAARPLPDGIGYTSITTLYDELITPQPEASHLEGATNIVLQDICPNRLIEHFTILADNLTYELVLDAISHPGVPAIPENIPASICSGPLYMPGVDNPQSALAALTGIVGFLSGFGTAILTGSVSAEPPLRDYATQP